MTSYGVIVQPRAEQDLERAYRHMVKHAPHLADRWLDDIQAAVGSLEELPSRCGLAPEASAVDRPVRHLLYGDYRILFIGLDRHVRVLTVRHQHRKPLRRIARAVAMLTGRPCALFRQVVSSAFQSNAGRRRVSSGAVRRYRPNLQQDA